MGNCPLADSLKRSNVILCTRLFLLVSEFDNTVYDIVDVIFITNAYLNMLYFSTTSTTTSHVKDDAHNCKNT